MHKFARRARFAATCAAVALGGCTTLPWSDDAPITRTQLSVWNRTQHDIFLVDQAGARLDVPACDEAVAADFQLNEVTIRAREGYIATFAAGAPDATLVRPMFLVITADPGRDPRHNFPMPEPPTQLPACAGEPQIQVGL